MKEIEITNKIKNYYKRGGHEVYKPPDTYGEPIECPECREKLYCRMCAKEIDRDQNTQYTPFKPADLCIVSPGGWIEVKRVKNRTERGMVFHMRHVKSHQRKTLERSGGLLGLGFIQNRKPLPDRLVGIYLIRWDKVSGEEKITRQKCREEAEKIVMEKELDLSKPEVKEDPVFAFMDGK